jgi:hypothetical protein
VRFGSKGDAAHRRTWHGLPRSRWPPRPRPAAAQPRRAGIAAGSEAAATGPVAAARCIRAHGVADFPHPPRGGGPQPEEVRGGKGVVDGVTLKETPAQVRAAQQACQGSLGQASAVAPTPQMVSTGDAFSACMRSQGIANFPDRRADGWIALPPGLHLDSPGFQAGQSACRPVPHRREADPAGDRPPHRVPPDRAARMPRARCLSPPAGRRAGSAAPARPPCRRHTPARTAAAPDSGARSSTGAPAAAGSAPSDTRRSPGLRCRGTSR